MSKEPAVKFVLAAFIAFALAFAPHVAVVAQPQQTAADSVISNRAEAIYSDEDGNEFLTVSPTVTVTVRAVSALVVTPDETAPSAAVAPEERITRLFRICNLGNTPDLYTITRLEVATPATLAALYFDIDASGTLSDGDAPATINSTMSPRLAPRACVGVISVVDVNASAPQTQLAIGLTARSNVSNTVNGAVEDTGTIINTIGERARLSCASPLETRQQSAARNGCARPGARLHDQLPQQRLGHRPPRPRRRRSARGSPIRRRLAPPRHARADRRSRHGRRSGIEHPPL
jgi:hypothetical protein